MPLALTPWLGAPCAGLVGSNYAVFVQRTALTAPFFLAHRELILGQLFIGSSCVPTLPWALFGDNMTAMPPQWEHACQPDFMIRLSVHCSTPRAQCAVCLEEKPAAESPGQLPCVHFICGECLPKTFTPLTRDEYARVSGMAWSERQIAGLSCPVCRHHFKGYAVVPSRDNNILGAHSEYQLVEFDTSDNRLQRHE